VIVGSQSAGEFVTETFDYDGGRDVTVYVPRHPPEAIVYAGDGQLISGWGPFIEAAVTTWVRGRARASG
jgi:hypothetical protein